MGLTVYNVIYNDVGCSDNRKNIYSWIMIIIDVLSVMCNVCVVNSGSLEDGSGFLNLYK